jgi:hypothetical protein
MLVALKNLFLRCARKKPKSESGPIDIIDRFSDRAGTLTIAASTWQPCAILCTCNGASLFGW